MVRGARELKYEEFIARVRRHRPSDLLPAIAARALQLPHPWTTVGRPIVVTPWALATAAKESILSGNEYRSPGASLGDVDEICLAYHATEDPLKEWRTGKVESSAGAFFVRLTNEQFWYQTSPFEEIARTTALFSLMFEDGDLPATEILTPSLLEVVYGQAIEQYVGCGLVFLAGAQNNNGRFDLDWIDQPNLDEIVRTVPRLRDTFIEHFGDSISGHRSRARPFRQPPDWRRKHEFNPLTARPFVNVGEGTLYVAPQPALIVRRLTADAVYYTVLEHFAGDSSTQDAFTRDVGVVFQFYLGKQLRLLPGIRDLRGEIEYDPGQFSIDWIAVLDDVVLLIEAKSTRLTQGARSGAPELERKFEEAVGTAFRQIDATERLIEDKHPSFDWIPRDRPRLGLVVTLEPYWMSNAPVVRSLLATSEPTISTLVVSVRELEHIAAAPIVDLGSRLVEIATDPERSTWHVSHSLDLPEGVRNPIHEEAWSRYPWAGDLDSGD